MGHCQGRCSVVGKSIKKKESVGSEYPGLWSNGGTGKPVAWRKFRWRFWQPPQRYPVAFSAMYHVSWALAG